MGKLFGRKKRFSDEEYENEEFDDDMFEDDEDDDEDDEIDEDEDDDDEDDDEEEDDDDEDDEIDEDDDEEDDEIDDEEDDEIDDDDEEDDEIDDNEDEDGDEIDEDDEDEDEDDDEIDDDEEWGEADRRIYRHRRRIRNQIIVYSVVFVFLAGVILGCIFAGRSIIGAARQKKLAEEQQKMEEEQQRLLEEQEARDVVIDAPEPIEEPEEDYLGEIVNAYISEMPLEDKVAGLFVVRPEAITGVSTVTQAGDGTREALNSYAVGGLIYFSKNILNKEQITEMLSNTLSMSKYPVFLAVDEEGGSVSRVAGSGIDVAQVGDMAAIGETGDTAQAHEAGITIGAYLREIGFNLDFAPVADVADASSSELGSRVFGSDAQVVSGMVSNMVEGLEGAGVSACLKHFPGIGDAEGDTHDGRVETSKTLDEMRNCEFLPFKAGIDAGVDFVMVSHITAPAVDEEALPSSLSKVMITDTLRNELGFQGIIITDALDMSAITEYYTSEQAAVMALEAGADMLLMPEDFNAAYEAVLAAVQDGTISESRIDESLERIYRLKCADKLE